MFSAGTRVYACSSSITGKKLGPKRHSLGYVSSSSTAYFVSFVKDFPIKDQPFIFFPLRIIFTRYGKEKKQRCEARDYLQILPAPIYTTIEDTKVKKIQKAIDVLNKGELSKNSHWNDIVGNYISNSGYMGTVIPVGHVNATLMDTGEATAWILSILHNPTFGNLIRTNRNLPTLKALVPEELLIWLASSVRSSGTRKDLLRWAEKDSRNMDSLIKSIQCVNTIFSRGNSNSSIKLMEERIKKGKAGGINTFATWLAFELFNDESIIKRKEGIIRKASISSKIINLTNCMRSIRDTHLAIKPKHV